MFDIDQVSNFQMFIFHSLTKSSVGFSRYLITISFTLHRCSSNSVFANDGAQLIVLHRHSMDSFSSLSTSSMDRHSKIKLSGSVFNALWCSMSISSVPISLAESWKKCHTQLGESKCNENATALNYLCCSNHRIRTRCPMNIPCPNSLTSWEIKIIAFVCCY